MGPLRNALPRDLADVLHYFLPELDDEREAGAPAPASEPLRTEGSDPLAARAARHPETPEQSSVAPPPLPILALPIGDRDVVRAALAWNLAVETSRLGASTVVLAPESDRQRPLWPEAGIGPLGCELLLCPAKDLASLYATATTIATARATKTRRGGVVFVRVPPEWLTNPAAPPDLVRWVLLMSSSNRHDLGEALEFAESLADIHSSVEVGVTVHGVQSIAEARRAFEALARAAKDQLELDLISYGLLVDDLNVYRAIAAQRPIGLAHPQAPATRALMDVARLLYEDARSRVLG